MESLAWSLSKEVTRHGIHMNVVALGLVETEMGRRLAKAISGIDDLRKLDESSPFGRVCQPEDIANALRFLVSEGAPVTSPVRSSVWTADPLDHPWIPRGWAVPPPLGLPLGRHWLVSFHPSPPASPFRTRKTRLRVGVETGASAPGILIRR